MAREHDTRSQRERDLAVRDQRAEKLRRAFENAPTLINAHQAAAIVALLSGGTQAGGQKADPIPTGVAVAGVGKREPGDDGPVQTLGLLAEDGRTWSVTGAGVCWPGGTDVREARRGGR